MAVPEAVRPLLDGLVSVLAGRFPPRLKSVYLLGSLAHGGFSPWLSDIDVCVVFDEPLEEADGPNLVAVSGELAEQFPRFGPRLSVRHASEATLRGEETGGRLSAIETVDLLQNGSILWGSDIRETIRPLDREMLIRAMYEDFSERWRTFVSPFSGRAALQGGQGEELDTRALVEASLFSARFLFTAETGRIAGCDEAARSFERRPLGPLAEIPRLAASIRDREHGEATPAERARLAAAFPSLCEHFFAEIREKYRLEPFLG